MKTTKKIFIAGIIVIFSFVFLIYAFFLFCLPKIFNSQNTKTKFEGLLSEKLGSSFLFDGLMLNTYPNLKFDISSKNIYIFDKNTNKIIQSDDFNYSSTLFSPLNGNLSIGYIFADFGLIKNAFNSPKIEKKNKKFDISKLPHVNIDKGLILFPKNFKVEIDRISTIKNSNKNELNIKAKVFLPFSKTPIIIGETGTLGYDKSLYADNFSVKLINSKLFLNGDPKKIKITASDLPAKELEETFLFFYKLRHPDKKNFLENFSNFAGKLDIDLTYSKSGFDGTCRTKNLKADFWELKIPVYLPDTVFYFKDRIVQAKTSGLFGPEKVNTDFYLQGIATDNVIVDGNVKSIFTDKLTSKYYPNVKLSGTAPAHVKYHVNGTKVDIDYILDVPINSNIKSKWGNLDNTDKYRKISMHTFKNGDELRLKSVDYLINGQRTIFASGNFTKIKGKYTLKDINLKTIAKVPVSVIQSFLKNYISNGEFECDLSLNILDDTLKGYINLFNISHSNFLFLKNTNIKIDNYNLKMNAEGSFFGSPIKAVLDADNQLDRDIVINNIDIHLDKFTVKKGKISYKPEHFDHSKKSFDKSKSSNNKFNVIVKKGHILVDEVNNPKFVLNHVELFGTLKNNIADFVLPYTSYAGGILSAKGNYHVKKHSSDIQFFASDIDSNVVATNFFNLPDQIKGSAFASMHVITKNKLNDVKAEANFAIDEGYLPKIGSTEFMIDNSKKKKNSITQKSKDVFKFTLSKITNIDFSKPEIYKSNLYGGFRIDNNLVKDAKMYSQSNTLSMFIEGDYDIDTQYGNVFIWGRRNKTAVKHIRIFKIPLNFILRMVFKPEKTADFYRNKINQIPEIKTNIADIVSLFRVEVRGNLNSENVNVILKEMR